ncbi:ATP-binding protein [Nocardioides donggukensis]|uniref:histidine kinase n=1 Tax=Nocardioides donggukensis TaxID=2774019 RepID=A0A927K6C3_9ACTN|nr:ATP-binding protein [Nocardioides donggukensis]MBD8868525.1 MASE1 domain-containing protein [Nocardioides donggukensis]
MGERDRRRITGGPDGYLSDRTWALLVVPALLAVLALGQVSVALAPPGSSVAAWWPAAGVSVALALWTRPGLLWIAVGGIFVFSGAANWLGGRPLDVSAGFALTNAAEAVVVVWWLKKGRPGPPRLVELGDLWRLIGAALLGATTAGVLGGLTVGLLTPGDLVVTGRAVMASHAAAVLILCPLVMLPAPRPSRISRVEMVLQPIVLVATVVPIFVMQNGLPLAFLPMPILAWGAARFGVQVAAVQLLLAGVVSSLLTTRGRGPFAAAVDRLDLMPEVTGTLLQANLVAYALVSLPIALVTAQSAAALERARSSTALLEGVMDAANRTAIIGTDLDSTITFFNAGAENLLGYSAEELVGLRTPEVFHDHTELAERAAELSLPPGLGPVGATLDSGATSEQRDWTWWARDGRRMTVSLRVSRRYDAQDRFIGYLGVADDVTETRRTEEVLRAALDREREAVQRLALLDQTKNDFVASVSHELRTPITSVMGNLELVLDGGGGELTPAQATMLERVDRNARRLLGLIEDLLTLSRVEAGTFRVKAQPTDLSEVVSRSLEALGPQGCTGDRLDVRTPAEPVTVAGDPDQLERVITNLVSNALKFSDEQSTVVLDLAAAPTGALLTVTDTGVGISPEDLPQVFDRFFRSAAATRQAVPGTGLGLSIVQAIVAGHGGRVEVESTEGVGSRFTAFLPEAGPSAAPCTGRAEGSQRVLSTLPSSHTGPSAS